MKLRIFALLLALFAALALVACQEEPEPVEPPTDEEEEGKDEIWVYQSGEIPGTSLTWELRSDDTLYIIGEGAMPEDMIDRAQAGDSDQPWGKFCNKSSNEEGVAFNRVVVEDGVTGLSQMSFKNCERLTEVVLGKGITKIPYDCFTGSDQLTRVVAKRVTVIDECAFQNCKSLKYLTVSAAITNVEIGAFDGAGSEAGLTLYLAGTEQEWSVAKETLVIVNPEQVGGNKLFADAMLTPAFVAK